MADKKQTPTEELLDRLNNEILAACDRRDKSVAQIMDQEPDWWVRSHKMEVARARWVLETADLRMQRHWIQMNLATMNPAKPVAIVNHNTD